MVAVGSMWEISGKIDAHRSVAKSQKEKAMTHLACVVLLLTLPLAVSADEPLLGFFVSSEEAQRDFEKVFIDTPTPAKARTWLQRLTEEPHVAGTPQEKKVADYVRERFEEFGLETEVAEYQVFLNYPEEVSLRLVEPTEMELPLMEESYDVDKDSTPQGMFPAFHGYGASGSASGQVVYVNYGTAKDYEKLDELGVSVEGKIALARYGEVFRGLKVKEAEEHGALGAILYSDPADDGYMKGDVYPDGPMRPASGIQRGSVQFLSIQPGDPSTPGYPSTKRARRVSRKNMKTVPRIPSLPISYASAEEILRRLGGQRVPDEWQGGLPFAYHVGPGGAAVSMAVSMDEGLRPIYNVFARISGTDDAGQLVILGNHRDAWNHGAVDPNSGTAALLETARGLAAALEAGWQPRRTILLASWDAEEYGLVGSTEWAEDHADLLQAQTVAYVNLDSAVTGDEFGIGGSPSLRDLVREVAGDLPDPKKGGTVGKAWEKRLRGEWNERAPVVLSEPMAEFELHLNPLGSGSDYTAFLDHLGIPSVSFGFSGSYGVYHSVYDNFRWVQKYGDPLFLYHAVAARFYGLMAMRLASADVVPLRFGSYAQSLRENLDVLRRDTRRKARGVTEETEEEDRPLNPDFTAIIDALDSFATAGQEADAAMDSIIEAQDRVRADRLNELLIQVEREFLSEEGLPPNRPWFRHLLYAPGTTTGYAAWPFPGPRQALEDKDGEAFDHEASRVVKALQSATRRLKDVRVTK